MSFSEPKIKSVDVSTGHLEVKLRDGRGLSLPLRFFPTLAAARPKQREQWELCGGDTGIHWPLLDYDLSIAGLLRGEYESPSLRSSNRIRYPALKNTNPGVLSETPPRRTKRG